MQHQFNILPLYFRFATALSRLSENFWAPTSARILRF
jgi:hypothetical protein